MNISEKGLNLIKKFEGLMLNAYRDQAGILTIGYGHTGDVKLGQVIDQEKADEYLENDLNNTQSFINEHVICELNQNQYDALCSLVFNIGSGNFEKSTLFKLLNSSEYERASREFIRWNKITVNDVKEVSAGLTKRRYEEQQLFLSNTVRG